MMGADTAEVLRRAGEAIDRLTRVVPDFPVPGVLFRDVTAVVADSRGLRDLIEGLSATPGMDSVDQVVGLEARGFLLGAALAQHRGIGVVALRKPGKLPGKVLAERYELEYGEGALEVHAHDVLTGGRLLIVDDVLATGGTAAAACRLIERAGARVAGVAVAIELVGLGGRAKLPGVPVTALRAY